jgi:tetratricopeptide (TPR) repeat protein
MKAAMPFIGGGLLLLAGLANFTSPGAYAMLQLGPGLPLTSHQATLLQADEEMTATLVNQLWAISDAAWHEGDYREAIAIERNIVALDPKDTEAWEVMAWLSWTEYGAERAVEVLKEGLSKAPERQELWAALGMQYFRMKQYEDAIGMYQQAVQRDAPVTTWKMFAHMLEKAGRKQEALPVWAEIVKRFPEDVPAQNNHKRLISELAQGETSPEVE